MNICLVRISQEIASSRGRFQRIRTTPLECGTSNSHGTVGSQPAGARRSVPARPPASTAGCNRGRRAPTAHRGSIYASAALASADLHPLKVACSVLPGAVLRSASDPCRQQALGPQNPHASGRSAPIAGGCSSFLRPAQRYEPQSRRAAAARARLAHRCCSCTPTLVLILSRGAAGSGRG